MERRKITIEVYPLGQEPDPVAAEAHLTPGERMAMIWPVTQQAYAMRGESCTPSPHSRRVIRVLKLES